jgi:hypothetical protein
VRPVQVYRVNGSDVDLLGNLDGNIDLDAELANRVVRSGHELT